uniref:YbjN domain-containing protein n=1 Tax=candidate division WOR-3 bacterium TaxID=2052148 RepID=A0A7C4GG03_UNCW3
MEFETQAQKKVYEKIAPWMRELFGQFATAHESAPVFGVVFGSTIAHVAVFPWGDDDATITTRAWVVTGTELTPDFMKFLLLQNDKMRFGAFLVDSDGDVFFEHTIVGSTCDKEELKASVLAVAATADRYDDEIVQRWGGQRMLDRMKSP